MTAKHSAMLKTPSRASTEQMPSRLFDVLNLEDVKQMTNETAQAVVKLQAGCAAAATAYISGNAGLFNEHSKQYAGAIMATWTSVGQFAASMTEQFASRGAEVFSHSIKAYEDAGRDVLAKLVPYGPGDSA